MPNNIRKCFMLNKWQIDVHGNDYNYMLFKGETISEISPL